MRSRISSEHIFCTSLDYHYCCRLEYIIRTYTIYPWQGTCYHAWPRKFAKPTNQSVTVYGVYIKSRTNKCLQQRRGRAYNKGKQKRPQVQGTRSTKHRVQQQDQVQNSTVPSTGCSTKYEVQQQYYQARGIIVFIMKKRLTWGRPRSPTPPRCHRRWKRPPSQAPSATPSCAGIFRSLRPKSWPSRRKIRSPINRENVKKKRQEKKKDKEDKKGQQKYKWFPEKWSWCWWLMLTMTLLMTEDYDVVIDILTLNWYTCLFLG